TVTGEELPGKVKALLEAFKAERQDGEIFADWFARTRTTGELPTPEQFHIELAERAAKIAEAKAAGEKLTEAG
ncbi:MAG TPA: hypothetical protein VGE39_01080, partial [Prosthecobacter sp.]